MSFFIALFFATAVFALVVSFRGFLAPPVTLAERLDEMMHQGRKEVGGFYESQQVGVGLIQNLEARLEGSGIRIQIKELIAISGIVGFVSFVFFWGATGSAGLGVFMMLGSFVGVPYFTIESRRQKRLQQIDEQLAESLGIMSSALKSGYSITQAFRLLEEETNDPIRQEFARINKDLTLGESLNVSLNNLSKRIASDDVDMFVSAVLIARQTGGDLSSILDNISNTIRERVALKREIRAKTATSRMSSTVLSLAPGAMFLIMFVLNGDYIRDMIANPLGKIILMMSFIMNAIGAYVVRRVSTIEGLESRKK